MMVIFVNIPQTALDKVAQAMFAAGAGCMDNYDQCCFVTEGIGQFRPLAGANPHIGNIAELTKVKEYKLETVCTQQNYQAVIQAMLAAHPYETPYWYAIEVK